MNYKIFDMEQYPRSAHFNYFRTLQYPYVGVTVNVDVTEFVAFCKQRGISFYLSFLHATALAANKVEALRQRIRDDKIIEYEACGTSHIELLEDSTYCYCTLYHDMPFEEYIKYAVKKREECKKRNSIEEDENVEELYFITTLPWLHYTAFLQPTAGGDESNPRISWGKFEEDAHGRKQLPVSILAHHSLVDGLMLAQFYENLGQELNDIMTE